MKITINNVTISDEQVSFFMQVTQSAKELGDLDTYNIRRSIEERIISRLVDKFMNEQGPEVVEKISTNQIINSILMRLATNFTGGNL